MKKNVLVWLAALTLASCSMFGPVKNNQHTYVLNTLNCNTIHAPPTSITLLVNTPEASQAFDSTQMAYSRCPYELTYYSKNAWVDTPPNMLLPLMVQSLQNTCHYHAVVQPPFGDHYDWTVGTQIIALVHDYSTCPSTVHLSVRAQVVNAATGKVVAARQFFVVATDEYNSPYGGVSAANRATAFLLKELTCFVMQATG